MSALQKPVAQPEVVLTKALLNTAKKLDLNQAQLSRILGVDPSTVSRMARGASTLRSTGKEWDAATTLIRIYRSLGGLLDGNESLMLGWFQSLNHDFGKSPCEAVLESAGGIYRVCDYLDSLRGRF
ncbi:DUF2384 domain-containing protein [Burkholderiaceae bacterium DAT-1]|nr:DUF2384 domain-containing protein [Burkholderiaceae bacterium DAT-1]